MNMAEQARKSWIPLLILLVLLVLLVAAGWWGYQRYGKVDQIQVIELNNRGIAYMEQYDYVKAADTFSKVLEKDPRSLPGKINLGIALLNQNDPASLDRASALFGQVLHEDPVNNYAEFCLGIIRWHQGHDIAVAGKHFEAVTKRDADDPHAWFFLGNVLNQLNEPARAGECYEKVIALDPYVPGAFNALQLIYRSRGEDKKANELLERLQQLNRAQWDTKIAVNYGEMGKYAEAIGRNPRGHSPPSGPLPVFLPDDRFSVTLAAGTRWALWADFGAGPEGDLRRAVRGRFGGTIVALDCNQDRRVDLYLCSAVLRDGKLEDLLLLNEGSGKFRDVTLTAGLAQLSPSLGCCVADFDNDGQPDLLFTGINGLHLLRNASTNKEPAFRDVTKDAGLDALAGVCLGAAFVDLDQDSDLDLIVTVVGADPAVALAQLKAPAGKVGGAALLLNIGEAPPNQKPEQPMPLTAKFERKDEILSLVQTPLVNVAVSDLDTDRDVDLMFFGDGTPPGVLLNDRLLKLRRTDLPEKLVAKGTWNGAAILDVNRDERSDLLAVGPGQKPALLVQGAKTWFTAELTNAPALLTAQALDIDLDGWVDIVGLSESRQPVLLHNEGSKLVYGKDGLGISSAWPKDLVAVLAVDIDEKCQPELLLWSEADGLLLHRNQGNGNNGLPVVLTGRKSNGENMRSNSDGIGARLGAQVRDLWTCAEVATLHAGLGQSRQPILLGLGKADHADFISIRWPDGVMQAEINLTACQRALIHETQRRIGSCPLLFTWNGKQFEYITDFLGAGSIGEPLPGGGHRPPRPEESVKIEAEQLTPKDGSYILKFAEPMDEVTYLDRLRLVVVDHPSDVRVYPDERFPAETRPATQDLLVFSASRQIFVKQARDHRGRDITQTLREWDRHTADRFAKRSWTGWAEQHWVELDFGEQLAKFGAKEPLGFFLAGWTDYPYPDSIWAAAQAGQSLVAPVLERLDEDGAWRELRGDLSFPAGLPRMMTYDLTGLVAGPSCKLRIRTNMHIYWDQIFIAPITERVSNPQDERAPKTVGVRALDVQRAELENRGCMQEFSPDGKQPTVYAYDRLDPVPVTRQAGKLTKFGDVTELLHERDDRFVIFGPGDELTVRFEAEKLAPLPAGWKRSFVLRTWGYCKDASPFTAHGNTIEPLPFHDMSNFPFGPGERYPETPRHVEYRRLWNTRHVGR
jgi:cytochrome c-type biogenesis protein CcmH/NrfG